MKVWYISSLDSVSAMAARSKTRIEDKGTGGKHNFTIRPFMCSHEYYYTCTSQIL